MSPGELQIDDGLGGADANLTNPQTLRIPKTGALAIVPSSPGRAATILMNPPTLKIQTKHTLAETCAKMNVVTKFLNCVVPRFTCTSAPLVDMVIIELAIIIQGGKNVVMSGKNVLMMPSPAMLMCSDLVLACFTHVNSLCNEEEDALAFEKMVRHLSHVCFFSRLHTSHEKKSCPKLLTLDQFRSCAA